MQDIFLPSGKWRWSPDAPGPDLGPRLELLDPAAPGNKMIVPMPDGDADGPPDPAVVAAAARDPDLRLWIDELGIPWRIAHIGPGTRFPFAVEVPHLVFDSERAFCGIVDVSPHTHLGELKDDELRRYRDRTRDFAGRRRAFRPPSAAVRDNPDGPLQALAPGHSLRFELVDPDTGEPPLIDPDAN